MFGSSRCHGAAQAELETLRASLEQASSAGSEQAAEWRSRAEAAEREVAAVRDRARALMEEKDSEIAALRVRGRPVVMPNPHIHTELHSVPHPYPTSSR